MMQKLTIHYRIQTEFGKLVSKFIFSIVDMIETSSSLVDLETTTVLALKNLFSLFRLPVLQSEKSKNQNNCIVDPFLGSELSILQEREGTYLPEILVCHRLATYSLGSRLLFGP